MANQNAIFDYDISGIEQIESEHDSNSLIMSLESLREEMTREVSLKESGISTPPVTSETAQECLQTPERRPKQALLDSVQKSASKRSESEQHALCWADFQVIETIGQGSFGRVFKVKPVLKRFRDKNFLVVKELQTELMPDYEAAKVMTEIELLNKLKTEGTGYVVNYEDAFVEGTCVNIVQEYCEKGDLSALINRRRHRTPAQISEQSIIKILTQMCLGMHSLHQQGILHRDIKALNVFLTAENTAKIGDLGSAVQVNQNQQIAGNCQSYQNSSVKLSKTQSERAGTPYYMAPELWKGKAYSEKTDVWAIGITLFELIKLERPFAAQNVKSLEQKIVNCGRRIESYRNSSPPTHVSKDLWGLLFQLLNPDPRKRPSVIEILQKDLIVSHARQLDIELPKSIDFKAGRFGRTFKGMVMSQVVQLQQLKDKKLPKSKIASLTENKTFEKSPVDLNQMLVRKSIQKQEKKRQPSPLLPMADMKTRRGKSPSVPRQVQNVRTRLLNTTQLTPCYEESPTRNQSQLLATPEITPWQRNKILINQVSTASKAKARRIFPEKPDFLGICHSAFD